MTKTAIACAALRLAARGVVDLDAPLPGHAYTLRHLLTHTSGLGCYASLPDYRAAVAAGGPAWDAGSLIGRCGGDAAPVAPRTRWAYSNLGYLIARRRLERAAGLPLADLLTAEVLAPAGLTRTRLARGIEPLPHIPGADRYDFGWVYHGCLLGPPAEAAAMMHSILDGDLLDGAGRATLRDALPLGGAIPGRPWTRIGYAMGLMSGAMGDRTAEGHSGAGPVSTCAVYRVVGTVAAAFSTAPTEAPPERAALRAARAPSGRA